MPAPDPARVRVKLGNTVMPARRLADDEVVVEDLLGVDPGDPISVDGQEFFVRNAVADPHAPGPNGPVAQTRISFGPEPTAVMGDRPPGSRA